jgi:hypothetical protein
MVIPGCSTFLLIHEAVASYLQLIFCGIDGGMLPGLHLHQGGADAFLERLAEIISITCHAPANRNGCREIIVHLNHAPAAVSDPALLPSTALAKPSSPAATVAVQEPHPAALCVPACDRCADEPVGCGKKVV